MPGKQEFDETLRYFRRQLDVHGVDVRLEHPCHRRATVAGYDEVVVATGVSPRTPDIPGVDHPSVVGYLDVLRDGAPVGDRVAILGAGGIGFDVAEFLTDGGDKASEDPAAYFRAVGRRHGLPAAPAASPPPSAPPRRARSTCSSARPARSAPDSARPPAGSTAPSSSTGASRWSRACATTASTTPDCMSRSTAQSTVLEVDTIVLCTGQDPRRDLYDALVAAGGSVHLIGGADVAAELDAKRAITAGHGAGGGTVEASGPSLG